MDESDINRYIHHNHIEKIYSSEIWVRTLKIFIRVTLKKVKLNLIKWLPHHKKLNIIFNNNYIFIFIIEKYSFSLNVLSLK